MNKRVKSNSIRIISGQWRGRKLEVVDAEGLRPTTDRVRETLFNWLMYDVQGARCLDMFAGSGALGFESLSRGASFVHFVELQQSAARSIKSELARFKVEPGFFNVSNTSFERILSESPAEPYDLVFLDPPFSQDFLPKVIAGLSRPGWLSDDAIVYLEQPSKQLPMQVPDNWHFLKERKAGQSRFSLYSLSER